MSDWANVRWTQARQIVALIDPKAAGDVPESVLPADYLSILRTAKRNEEAITFLALALPRFDGVAWAAKEIDATPPAGAGEAGARAAVAAWIGLPDDAHRRAAWKAGEAADDWSPERLLTHAVFLSGGSMAPADLPPVHPQPDLSGRMAAGAIVVAAHRSGNAVAALERALMTGEAVARRSTR